MKIRLIEVLRAGWGAVLLTAPSEVLDHIPGVQVDLMTHAQAVRARPA